MRALRVKMTALRSILQAHTKKVRGLPLTLLKFVGRNDDSIMDYAASLFDSTVGSGSGCKAATSLGMSA